MRVLLCLLVALACLPVRFAHAQTSGAAYAVDYDQLYRIDLSTRSATLIGKVGGTGQQQMADLSGLTISSEGTMYVASDTLKALIRVDPQTGKGSVIGNFGIQQNNPSDPLDFGMTAACDGSLWLSSPVTRQLWKVNPASARATLVGQLGHTITGLVVDHDSLYGVGSRGEEGWYSIDTHSGHASLIGSLGSAVSYLTSASPALTSQGQVLAAFNYVPLPDNQSPPPWSDLARIDPATGSANKLGTITGPASLEDIGIRGFAIGPPACGSVAAADPVGAPTLAWWSRLLLALLVGGLGALFLRRQSAARAS